MIEAAIIILLVMAIALGALTLRALAIMDDSQESQTQRVINRIDTMEDNLSP